MNKQNDEQEVLPGIKLDNQLLFNRNGDIFPRRQGLDQTLLAFQVKGKPMRQRLVLRPFQRIFYGRLIKLPLIGRDHIAFFYNIRRNVDAFPIYQKMVVIDQLPRGATGFSQPHAINNIVQPRLKPL